MLPPHCRRSSGVSRKEIPDRSAGPRVTRTDSGRGLSRTSDSVLQSKAKQGVFEDAAHLIRLYCARARAHVCACACVRACVRAHRSGACCCNVPAKRGPQQALAVLLPAFPISCRHVTDNQDDQLGARLCSGMSCRLVLELYWVRQRQALKN